MAVQLSEIHEYMRWRKRFPTVWCSGCGIGTVMGAIIHAVHELQIPKDDIALISGIGCSSRMPIYVDFNTLHTTHGRALPFATGVKLVRPEMTVIVVSGDGDGLAIGGNHFIHSCRRNIDINMILINNSIYGMTGGQVAPTTPLGAFAHTAPYGNIDPPFDAVELSLASGATFVARSTTYHVM
ncbi:2-oxoacid:ferredoxin oxidoreductase subunit beta, partial [bacterium]